jgi:N-acylneuraminate cytidylyltransferase
MSSNVLAVVPARGGSKRLPRKNVRELDGKPLVAHAIAHGEAATEVDKTVVSTEDEEIQAITEEYGKADPIDRPTEFATDTATADEAVRHAIQELEERGETFDIVCMLLPTTPFRRPEDIDEPIYRLKSSDAQSIVGVTDFDHPPFYAVDEDDDGYLRPYFGNEYLWSVTRSQEMPSLQQPSGVIFAADTDALFEHENFYTDRTLGYETPPKRSIDIDEAFDLELARALIQYRRDQ